MTMPQRVKGYTPEEYYRLEQEAEGKWEFREFKGMEDILKIPPLGIEIPLARIYRTVEFEPSMRPLEG